MIFTWIFDNSQGLSSRFENKATKLSLYPPCDEETHQELSEVHNPLWLNLITVQTERASENNRLTCSLYTKPETEGCFSSEAGCEFPYYCDNKRETSTKSCFYFVLCWSVTKPVCVYCGHITQHVTQNTVSKWVTNKKSTLFVQTSALYLSFFVHRSFRTGFKMLLCTFFTSY